MRPRWLWRKGRSEGLPELWDSKRPADGSTTGKKSTVLSDEKTRLTGLKTQEHYPDKLRLVTDLVEVK